MEKQRNSGRAKRTANTEGEKLDALNARIRRKFAPTRLIEATIEAKAKKRRTQQAPASSSWKR